MAKIIKKTLTIPTELLLIYIKFINLIISNIHLMIFRKVLNKKIFIKFNIFEIFQILLIKIYNRLFSFFKLLSNSHNNFPISRNKLLFAEVKSILEYPIKNNIDINKFIIGLDKQSKETINKIFRNLYYVYTHSLIERLKLFNVEDFRKSLQITKYVDTLKEQIILSNNHYENIVFYYHCGLKFLPNIILNTLKDKDFIDGGAYNGDSALLFEKYYNPRKIYSFEPENINYNHLINTIKINNLKKVVPKNLGLGEKNEVLKIAKGGKASKISRDGNYDVKITSLDNFVMQNKLSVGLIKLDVEGFAFKVMKGAKKTLEKFKPILLIAIYHNGEEFFEILKFIKKLKLNYHCIIRSPPLSFVDETLLIAWVEK